MFKLLGDNFCKSTCAVLQRYGHPALKYQQQCLTGLSWTGLVDQGLKCPVHLLVFDMSMCPQEEVKWTSLCCREALPVSRKQGPGLLSFPPMGTSSTFNAELCECKGFVALAALSNLGTTLLKQGQEITFKLNQGGWWKSALLVLRSVNPFWSTVSS